MQVFADTPLQSYGLRWGATGELAGKSATRDGNSARTTSQLPRAVYRLASRVDNTSLWLLDAGVITGAWLAAFFAGYEGDLTTEFADQWMLYSAIALPIVTQLVVNRMTGLYGPIWRYASIEEATRVVVAVGGGTAVAWIELVILSQVSGTTLPIFTAPPIAALLILLGCGGIRFQARLFALERQGARKNGRVRTVIVGATNAGVALARELEADDVHSDVKLIGFVDNDLKHLHRSIRGLRVLGATTDLDRVCRENEVHRILIALPQAGRDKIKEVVDLALKTEAQVKVLPRASDLIDGPLVQGLRDINLDDLVGREHAPVDVTGIGGYLAGATVLITGAGGSIGSEIARQVAEFGPRKLVLLDRDDSLLCEAGAELPDAQLMLASILDRQRVADTFEQERPDVIFHAAAHKHVPILEDHPVEAMQTNLLGTWWLARTAAHYGCRRFVHISTDKAVNPCSIMGATKRAAELVVFAVGREYGLPSAVVRFGNVIGSRGSVVPVFLRQILDGGPVTLTDPEMKRYFMTIPEAVSLVLQAGSMTDGGKIFLFDMGEPASILAMARQMIRLAGLRPDEDIEIKVTGRRPGERLVERLYDENESVAPTSHPSIWSVTPLTDSDPATLFSALHMVEGNCGDADGAAAIRFLERLLVASGVPCDLRLDAEPKRDMPEPENPLTQPLSADGVLKRDADATRT
jgi:FlaA1/EpsC-like NDP-sugar epimerase